MYLETFQIPQFFLLLQTLSSGVYLFGKSVSPNTKDELEQHIAKLMTQSTLSREDESYLRNTIASLFGPKAVGPMLQSNMMKHTDSQSGTDGFKDWDQQDPACVDNLDVR